jgi:micrococcal nuclease
MGFSLYHYKATVLRVVDGDTAWLRIDRGYREFFETSCRLYGINAPELSTGAPGAQSRDWLAQRITGKTLYVKSEKLDKYGRPLVTLFDPEPATDDFKLSINAEMLAKGLAVVFAD